MILRRKKKKILGKGEKQKAAVATNVKKKDEYLSRLVN